MNAVHSVAVYASEHVKDLGSELWIPLQDAAVVVYARPFTQNKPFGPLAAKWGKFDDPRSQKLHDETLDMRHKMVAHEDASERRVMIFPPAAQTPVPVREARRATSAVAYERPTPTWFKRIDALCLDLGAKLHQASEGELQELYGEDTRTRPFDLISGDPIDWPRGPASVLSHGLNPWGPADR